MQKSEITRKEFSGLGRKFLELCLKILIVVLGYLAFMSIVLAGMQLIYSGGLVYMD